MLPLRLLLGSAAGVVFDYYVDSVAGNNANAGTMAAPFASFAPLTAIGALGGKSIAVKRGSTIADSLLVTGNGITVDVYGTGAVPLLECSDVIPNAGWTKTVGRTNVYERTITLPNDVKAKGNVWSDDNFLVQVTSVALCDAQAGSAYVTDWTAASATLYVNAIGSTVPGADGKAYSYSRRLYAINLTSGASSGHTVRNLRARRNAHQDGSIICGPDSTGYRLTVEDGCRHALLFGPGALLDQCKGYRGRNDLEGSANGFVVNAASVVGLSYRTRDCIFDAGDTPAYTGFQNHGGVTDELFTQIIHERPTFIGLLQSVDVASADTQVISPTYTNCVLGAQLGRIGGACVQTDAVGSVNQIFSAAATNTSHTSRRSVLSAPVMASTGFYSAVTAASTVACVIDTDQITITDTASKSTGSNDLIRVANGSLTYTNSTFGPVLANPSVVLLRAGFGGGSCTVAASGNTLPLGAMWILNGTTYSVLATWQGTGRDTGSAYGAIPAASFSDDFNRADENLEASANWTRIGGAAAQAGVRSNAMAHLGSTQTLYAAPALATSLHYARGLATAAIPVSASGFPLTILGSDQSNYVAARWSTTVVTLWTCIAGTLAQKGTISRAISGGEDFILARRGDYAWIYSNGEGLLTQVALGATALNANVRAGTVPRAVQNPALDNFSCGVFA